MMKRLRTCSIDLLWSQPINVSVSPQFYPYSPERFAFLFTCFRFTFILSLQANGKKWQSSVGLQPG